MRPHQKLPDALSALLMDSYQLTMTQGYLDHGMVETAVFEFFVRRMPPDRCFLIAAGLEQTLEFLETLRFSTEEIHWLRRTGLYRENLLEYLSNFRFSGDVWAVPEGTAFFANEPIFQIHAPISQAQIIETRIINLLQYQTLVASKAARAILVAQGNVLVDFGLRRAHGAEAGLFAARASYLAGFDGTSNLLAGKVFGIPLFGTMAHSYVEAHDEERAAFFDFSESNPKNTTLLIDTYDTEKSAEGLGSLARELAKRNIHIQGVRIDSGDLAGHARRVRSILNDSGLRDCRIFASGDIDEYQIRELLAQAAPIDGFGVGTNLVTSSDVPYLNCAYKLEEYAGVPRQKRSEGKATLPGAKQVFRCFAKDGQLDHDVLGRPNEALVGSPLLECVMRQGRRTALPVPLSEIRRRCSESLKSLPSRLKSILNDHEYPVKYSPGLQKIISSDQAA